MRTRRSVALAAVLFVTACGGEARPETGPSTATTAPTTEPSMATDPAPTEPATTEPATTAEPSTTAPAVTDPAPPPASENDVPWPDVDPALATRLPVVAGYDYADASGADIPWFTLDLPEGIEVFAGGVTREGRHLGHVIVARPAPGQAMVDELFARQFRDVVHVVRDQMPSGDEELVLTNTARATWTRIGEAAVVAAVVDDAGRWMWFHEGLVWIAAGRDDLAGYVTAATAEQQRLDPLDPYDYGPLGGDLWERMGPIAGYTFVDLPRTSTLDAMGRTVVGDCAQHLYTGYVVTAEDPDWQVMQPEDLALDIARVSPVCRDDGFFDQLAPALASSIGAGPGTIAGVPVLHSANHIVVVDDDVVAHLGSADPQRLVDMKPFIDEFVARWAS